MSGTSGNNVPKSGVLTVFVGVGEGRDPLVGGDASQSAGNGSCQEAPDATEGTTAQYVSEPPSIWVERNRLRRVYQALAVYDSTRSDFLIEWAQNELMHMVRDL